LLWSHLSFLDNWLHHYQKLRWWYIYSNFPKRLIYSLPPTSLPTFVL
jgi:hypothetical protein